jgi:dienelactone hydrolase
MMLPPSGTLLTLASLALAAGIAAVLGVVGVQYYRNDRPILLPKPRGPYPVGRVLFDWTDDGRHRELMIFVWYPAPLGTVGRTAEYLPDRWGELAFKRTFPIPARRIRETRVSAIEHAPFLAGRHPVLILSPAMGSIPADYSSLAEDLASFGYIVAGVTPTGSARVVVFSNGRIVYGEDSLDLEHPEFAQPLVERWVGDFSYVLDRLASEPMFSQRIDWMRAGVIGHSFGGAAVMHALRTEERFKRGANLDGAPQGVPIAGLTKPLVIVNGEPLPPSQKALNDRILSEMKRICDSDSAGCRFEDFPEAGHMNFSDVAVLPSRFPIPRSHFGLTSIDGPAFLRKISDLLRVFFDEM